MSLTTSMKQHDLEPDLTLYAEDAGGGADLTQVVSWRVIATMAGEQVFVDTSPAVTVDPANHTKATIVHTWAVGETTNAGDLKVEAEAMWPGNRPQTFPASGAVTVRIRPDLG